MLAVQYACNRKWSILKNERKYLLHKLFSVTYKNFNLDLEHKFTTFFLLPGQHIYIIPHMSTLSHHRMFLVPYMHTYMIFYHCMVPLVIIPVRLHSVHVGYLMHDDPKEV